MGFFIFLLIVGAVVYFIKTAKAAQEQWKVAAQRLNLVYHPGELGGAGSIMGNANGHRVTVNTVTNSGENSTKTYTHVRLAYRDPVAVDFRITLQGMKQEPGKAYGLQYVETGNPKFDDYFVVRGAHPDKVRDLLTSKLQSALRDLALGYGCDVTVTGNYVETSKPGKVTDAAVIVNTVRRLSGFCETMMEVCDNTETVSHTLEVDAVPSAMPIIEIEPPEIPFDPLSSANPIVPDPPAIPVEQDEPDFPEEAVPEMAVGDAVAVAEEEPVSTTGDVIESAPEVPEEHVVAEPIDLVDVAKDLFGDSGSSLLMSKRFDEQFKDRAVTGSGELTRVGKFSYDPVFTNTEGVKAIVSVCELQGTYSKIKVVAEVMYPPEKYDYLAARTDSILPIDGALIGQDAMMHRLFIVAL